jgi:hypothetical protein
MAPEIRSHFVGADSTKGVVSTKHAARHTTHSHRINNPYARPARGSGRQDRRSYASTRDFSHERQGTSPGET